ncbi:hypothetical protein ACOME3_001064 [Neoechinorhynchus agilis]
MFPTFSLPVSAFPVKVDDLITMSIVYTENDLEDDANRPKYSLKYLFHVFGDEETIYGYEDLKVDLIFSGLSYNCLLKISYKKRMIYGPYRKQPIDVKKVLRAHLPNRCTESEQEFREWLRNDLKLKWNCAKETNKVHYVHNDGVEYLLQWFRADELEGFAKQVHSNIEHILPFEIEGARRIDLHDRKWIVYVLFELMKLDNGQQGVYVPIGILTAYLFYGFPDRIKPRIGQIYITPNRRNRRHGYSLLKSVFCDLSSRLQISNLTMEMPTKEVSRLRNRILLGNLLEIGRYDTNSPGVFRVSTRISNERTLMYATVMAIKKRGIAFEDDERYKTVLEDFKKQIIKSNSMISKKQQEEEAESAAQILVKQTLDILNVLKMNGNKS